jgi:hypothetical protein
VLKEGEEKEQKKFIPNSPYLCYRKVRRRSREVRNGLLITALMERREV